MKLRILLPLIAIVLTACNFSLAEDVTPPPNYVPPTPAPTLGPLFPAQAPNIQNGAAIFAEKCAACHGDKGLGDGAQGKQLPVTVAALGLPQIGRAAVPATWYTTVTRGNLERYMPPFASLDDQQRWDVVAFALSLHTTPEQVAQGKTVFETNCAACPLDSFSDQTAMAALSDDALVQLLKTGSDKVTAFPASVSEDDLYAAAAYLRSLTFAASSPTPEPATVTPTVAAPTAETPAAAETVTETPAADAATPSAEGTPLATESTTPVAPAASGKVTGSITGANVSSLTVTLRGYDHAADASGPQETVTLTAVTDANGNYVFEGLDMPENRIYVAEVTSGGVTFNSDVTTLKAGQTELALPALQVYEISDDYSTLTFDQVHFFVQISGAKAQIVSVYTFQNKGTQAIRVASTDSVPFIKTPTNAEGIQFELTQDSAPLLAAEGGFAIPPSDKSYGIVAIYTLPYDGKVTLNQPFALPATSVLLLVSDGLKVKTDQLTEGQPQTMQDAKFLSFAGGPFKAEDTLIVNLSGTPKGSSATTTSNSRQDLLIGLGALGLVLIAAGVWLYLRDRNRPEEELEEEVNDEFESEEDVLDAIIALDDLHRSGKIKEEAYKARREELKAKLKN